MKRGSAKKQAKNPKPEKNSEITRPVEVLLRAPTLPGSPLRVEEFPTLEQVARLSCLLANGSPPSSPNAARSLAAASLEIWRGCRDELAETLERSAAYWNSRDQSASRLSDTYEAVNAFLSDNEGTHLIGADRVSWDEAIAVLSSASSKRAATAELERIVSTNLAGREPFTSWNLDHFKELGFDPFSFPTLIRSVAEDRARHKAEARRAEMKHLARLSSESRKRKKETEEWGTLATGKETPTSPKKST